MFTSLLLSPRASTTNRVLFLSSKEELQFVVHTRDFRSLRARAQQTGSSSCPLEKNYHLLCSRVPIVLSTHKHAGRGLLLFLSWIILIHCCVYARLSFSPLASTANGLFFLSYQEELLFTVLVRASRSLCVQVWQTGYSSCLLEKNSHSPCSIFWDGQRWRPNFYPVTKIKSWGGELL